MNSKGYTYTITTSPEHAQLLNRLVETHILPVLNKREEQQKLVAQASMPRKKLTAQEERDRIFDFLGMDPTKIQPTTTDKNVQQGSTRAKTMSQVEQEKLNRLIEFSTGKRII